VIVLFYDNQTMLTRKVQKELKPRD